MRRFRTPAFYVGRNASLVLRLRRAVVSGRRSEQQIAGSYGAGSRGGAPGEKARRLSTTQANSLLAQASVLQHNIAPFWLRLRRAVISETKQVSTWCDGG